MRQAAFGIDTEEGKRRRKDQVHMMEHLKSLVSKYHQINDANIYMTMMLEFYQTDWTFSGF